MKTGNVVVLFVVILLTGIFGCVHAQDEVSMDPIPVEMDGDATEVAADDTSGDENPEAVAEVEEAEITTTGTQRCPMWDDSNIFGTEDFNELVKAGFVITQKGWTTRKGDVRWDEGEPEKAEPVMKSGDGTWEIWTNGDFIFAVWQEYQKNRGTKNLEVWKALIGVHEGNPTLAQTEFLIDYIHIATGQDVPQYSYSLIDSNVYPEKIWNALEIEENAWIKEVGTQRDGKFFEVIQTPQCFWGHGIELNGDIWRDAPNTRPCLSLKTQAKLEKFHKKN